MSDYQLDSKNRPVAITVSANYSDVLAHTLPHNIQFFKHWYIVTSPRDLETQRLVREFNHPNVTLLEFDFQAEAVINGRPTRPYFNKGGGIRYGQETAYAAWPDTWYLVMDTDIMIRSGRDLIASNLRDSHIYGVRARFDYRSWSDYCQGTVHYCREMWEEPHQIIGFFQLYKLHGLYEQSIRTDLCDDTFPTLWAEDRRALLNVTVDHLGYWAPEVKITHFGRELGNGFIDD